MKLLPEADRALVDMSTKFGWTITRTVERALLFSATCKGFGGFKPSANA